MPTPARPQSLDRLRAGALAASLLVACACGGPRSEAPADPVDAARARRIVAANATAVDYLVALVGPGRVAAVPEQAREYSVLHAPPDGWADLPSFSSYLAEEVLALAPDLVLVDRWQSIDTTRRLREAGVAVLELPEVTSWEAARSALLELGEALGSGPRAREQVADLERRVERLASDPGRRAGCRVLVYSNFGARGWTAGARTSIDAMIQLAGLVNLAAAEGRVGPVPITFEELLVLDPDLFLVSEPLSLPAGHSGDRGGASAELLRSEPALADLRAVREEAVVELPAWLFATGSHEIVRGAEELARRVELRLTAGAAAGVGDGAGR